MASCGLSSSPEGNTLADNAAISQESALVKLDDLRTALLDFAGVYLPVGDARMLVLSAAEKVGMAADAIEAEYV